MKIFNFNNSYKKLLGVFYADAIPESVEHPELVLWNDILANELGIAVSQLTKVQLAEVFSGNLLPDGASPLAMAYAGHQFGYFSMLGDGRAVLLGEHLNSENKRFDIQLKGSGRTPFSRRGDGRATLRSMLREYLMSECMHKLGVPTSRSLAVVQTGLPVHREKIYNGAVLTRIMDSHLRIGTFEYARQYSELAQQKELLDYTLARHYPDLLSCENPALAFLKAVINNNLDLVIHWMRIGFIHGVMNTDNISVVGKTFDYGPCAFMNAYDTHTVYSSIDTNGRYAYGNQPDIMLWNSSVLAGTLLPFLSDDQDLAVEMAKSVLNQFSRNYQEAWKKMMCGKLGFNSNNKEELILLDRLLDWMKTRRADYTNAFLILNGTLPRSGVFMEEDFITFQKDWKAHVCRVSSWESALETMSKNNPLVIPRNLLVEKALDEIEQNQSFELFHKIISGTGSKNMNSSLIELQESFEELDAGYQTFCGT